MQNYFEFGWLVYKVVTWIFKVFISHIYIIRVKITFSDCPKNQFVAKFMNFLMHKLSITDDTQLTFHALNVCIYVTEGKDGKYWWEAYLILKEFARRRGENSSNILWVDGCVVVFRYITILYEYIVANFKT
jgi:hypothetical protein